MSTSETVAVSTSFRPDVNTSTEKSREIAAAKEKKQRK